MKVKLFKIRLADEHLENDQEHINHFLSTVEINEVVSALITGKEHYWSLVIHYSEKRNLADGIAAE